MNTNSTSFVFREVTNDISKTINYLIIGGGSASFTGYVDINSIQLELGTVATSYQPYKIRTLETINQLGNIPITNLENMNTFVFKPAVEIIDSMTSTASTAIGFSLKSWQFVINIWNRIWGVE